MTGFGRGEASAGGITIETELSSVNRKRFDARISLPRPLMMLESQAYELLREKMSRGMINGSVKMDVSGTARRKCLVINRDTAKACISGLRKTAAELRLDDNLSARELVYLPDVVRHESLPVDAQCVWPLLKTALRKALEELIENRKTEGKAIERDLVRRFTALRRMLEQIRKKAPRVANHYRTALRKRISSMGIALPLTDAGLMRELALFAERSDISEEIVRLQSHFAQASKFVRSKTSSGRGLDFLCQEMFREINTIGSKANDASITRHVIAFKTDLESIREQVQNVE